MQIDEILKKNQLITHFQPIISLDTGKTHGYEALTRGPEGELSTPLALFSEAKRYNCLAELDNLCCCNTLRHAQEQKLEGLLFINIDPISVFERLTRLTDILCTQGTGFIASHIVLEFTMSENVCKFNGFADLVRELKDRGFLIACDNTVPGNTEVLSVHNLRPDYIKIDFLGNSSLEPLACQSACDFAQLMQTPIIAVGIQSVEQLRTLANSGIKYAQGNFIAPPQPFAPSIQLSARALLAVIAAQRRNV